MDFFSIPIVAMLVMLGVLVLVHECGHFIVGRLCGLAVESFSIGFGPQLVGFTRKHTRYRIGILPLGGYVKFVGMIPGEEVPEHMHGIAYNKASRAKRLMTVAAGPIANLILAFGIYSFLATVGIEYQPANVGFVMPGTPADRAGLQVGDQIRAIGDSKIQSWEDLNSIVQNNIGRSLNFKVERTDKNGQVEQRDYTVTPESVEGVDLIGRKKKIGRIGIGSGVVPSVVTIRQPNSPAAQLGIQTGDKITQVEYAGTKTAVAHYAEFLKAYRDWMAAADAGPLTYTLENEKQTRTVVQNAKTKVENFGLSPSQTTVAEAKDSLSGLLKRGDVILSLGGRDVATVFDLYDLLEKNDKPELPARVMRAGEVRKMTLPLKEEFVQKPEGRVKVYAFTASFLGSPINPPRAMEVYSNPFEAFAFGLKRTVRDTGFIAYSLGKLVTGDIPLKSLGGPILIAKVASESVKMGWRSFVLAMALISINLAVINMFPIPALDGGQIVLIAFEGIRGRPLSETAMENFQKVGFVMVLALIVLAFSNDLSRFWADILHSMVEYF